MSLPRLALLLALVALPLYTVQVTWNITRP
jgi:hypothetical protein